MNVGPISFGFSPLRASSMRVGRFQVESGATVDARPDLRSLAGYLLDARESLEALLSAARPERTRSGSGSAAATAGLATSSFSLGLETTPKAAVLRSAEEVNTTPTSYSTHVPEFEGASSPDVEIQGVYDGSHGDTTLRFEVASGGLVGLTSTRLNVIANGQVVETVQFAGSYDPGTPVQLENGLTIALGSGTTFANDGFEIEVSSSVGTAVDPDASFDGTGDDVPEFESTFAVGAGSFTINGAAISVASDDTLTDVLAKITASAAGVTASFDALTETVILTQDTEGSAEAITLGADTSGFLAATKLDTAVLEPGSDDERTAALAEVDSLSGVVAGTFFVQGVAIDVDPALDSLTDVLERIEANVEGVTATYDADSGRVTISGGTGNELTLGGDAAGFLAAIGIDEGIYEAQPQTSGRRRSQISFHDTVKTRSGLLALESALTPLTSLRLGGRAGDRLAGFGAELRKVLSESLAEVDETLGDRQFVRTEFGLDFDFRGKDEVLQIDLDRFRRALREDPERLVGFLAGEGGSTGLLGRIDRALETTLRGIANGLDPTRDAGLILDLRA